jgi:GNAT superfamily N-acetyltransferase
MNGQIRKIEFLGPEFGDWLTLRFRVLREPLGLKYSEEDIAKESDQHHICFFQKRQILGGLIIHLVNGESNGEFKMRQVAVDPEFQGQGIGAQLVLFAEGLIRDWGGTQISLHSRLDACPFYEKLGYESLDDPFVEVGLIHYLMKKKL